MIREVRQVHIRPVKNLSGVLTMCRNFFLFFTCNLKIKIYSRSENTSIFRYKPKLYFVRVFFHFLKKTKVFTTVFESKTENTYVYLLLLGCIFANILQYLLNLSVYMRVSININLLFKKTCF